MQFTFVKEFAFLNCSQLVYPDFYFSQVFSTSIKLGGSVVAYLIYFDNSGTIIRNLSVQTVCQIYYRLILETEMHTQSKTKLRKKKKKQIWSIEAHFLTTKVSLSFNFEWGDVLRCRIKFWFVALLH